MWSRRRRGRHGAHGRCIRVRSPWAWLIGYNRRREQARSWRPRERSHDAGSHDAGSQGGAHDAGSDDTAGSTNHDRRRDRPYPRLEDCDLSLRLSKDEEAKRLGKAQRRLLHLRLINGGQLNNGVLGPPVCIVFEGWDAAGKGGAIKRLVEPLDPRHVHVAPFAAPDARRVAAPLPVAVLAAAARMGRHDHLRPQLVRARAGGAGGELRHRGAVAARLPGDRRLRALAGRRGNGRDQALDAHVGRGAAAPVRAAPGRSAQGVEADRRGLAQPGEAGAVRRARSPTCCG